MRLLSEISVIFPNIIGNRNIYFKDILSVSETDHLQPGCSPKLNNGAIKSLIKDIIISLLFDTNRSLLNTNLGPGFCSVLDPIPVLDVGRSSSARDARPGPDKPYFYFQRVQNFTFSLFFEYLWNLGLGRN